MQKCLCLAVTIARISPDVNLFHQGVPQSWKQLTLISSCSYCSSNHIWLTFMLTPIIMHYIKRLMIITATLKTEAMPSVAFQGHVQWRQREQLSWNGPLVRAEVPLFVGATFVSRGDEGPGKTLTDSTTFVLNSFFLNCWYSIIIRMTNLYSTNILPSAKY